MKTIVSSSIGWVSQHTLSQSTSSVNMQYKKETVYLCLLNSTDHNMTICFANNPSLYLYLAMLNMYGHWCMMIISHIYLILWSYTTLNNHCLSQTINVFQSTKQETISIIPDHKLHFLSIQYSSCPYLVVWHVHCHTMEQIGLMHHHLAAYTCIFDKSNHWQSQSHRTRLNSE